MTILAVIPGMILILGILWDTFETVVLPRRVTRKFRLTRLFYHYTWLPFSKLVRGISGERRREMILSFYGPLSFILLVGCWALGLVFGFALLHWAGGTALRAPDGAGRFTTDLYLSGTTFFTLGLGDVAPVSRWARILVVLEAGMGLGFLALVISYLPALNQSFSKREVSISLLDARAGSPPTAAEILRRHSYIEGMEALRQLLHEWERWAAEFLEIHLSFPVLAYFRSQHDNQSWPAALTAILDTCSLIMVGLEGACEHQARLTFAMARHAVVDLCLVFKAAPEQPNVDRLTESDLDILRKMLADNGLKLRDGVDSDRLLAELRRMYEPYIHSLARYLCVEIPPWIFETPRKDNWQTSQWQASSAAISTKRRRGGKDMEHF